jgi:hypothetical protein
MSAFGHKRAFSRSVAMSAIPPKADIHCDGRNVRFVPIADIERLYSITSSARRRSAAIRRAFQDRRLVGFNR